MRHSSHLNGILGASLLAFIATGVVGCSGCESAPESDDSNSIATPSGDDLGDNDSDENSGLGSDDDGDNGGQSSSDAGSDGFLGVDAGSNANSGSTDGGTDFPSDITDGGSGGYPENGICGDGNCDENENCALCSEDCGICVQPAIGENCGNGTCEGDEGCFLCQEDCGPCADQGASICGDAICSGDEGCQQCPEDCSICPEDAGTAAGFCGDLMCGTDESCETCQADCGLCDVIQGDGGAYPGPGNGSDAGAPVGGAEDAGSGSVMFCGDGICSEGENTSNCWQDCGVQCGDDVCNGPETCDFCPEDCGLCEEPTPGAGYCGDGWCTLGETTANCWQDCGSLCGDDACNHIETCNNCEVDCGICQQGGPTNNGGADAGVEDEDCKGGPEVIGNPCDDGNLSTRDDICVSHGLCLGDPFECYVKKCQVSSTPNGTNCDIVWADDGTSCEDDLYCTVADKCNGGICMGLPRDCSGFESQCLDAQCDEALDLCAQENKPPETECNDDLYCTVEDHCYGGSCVGEARDCSAVNDQCNKGKCNETEEICEKRALPLETSCENSDYCTVNDYCTEGECLAGQARDCSWVSQIDSCYDGECNSSQEACAFIDNETCTDCDQGKPVANTGSNQTVAPDEMVNLNGSASSDPENSPLEYAWEMISAPSGTNTNLVNPSTATPHFLGDVSGEYVICLVVTDEDECPSDPDCVTVQVRPQVAVHVELTWDNSNSDLDLHYRAPSGSYFNNYTDCYYNNKTPDWGAGSIGSADGITGNDPRLDVDNTYGLGPENINQDEPFDTVEGYRIAVHYWCDYGSGSASARIRIFVNGSMAYETTKLLEGADFWEVADVSVWGDGTYIDIAALQNPTYKNYSPSCH